MGWNGESWSVHVLLDAHAGDREREDEALWIEMQDRLQVIRNDPKYAQLQPD